MPAQDKSILTEKQKKTGNALTEVFVNKNLPAIREKFNKLVAQRKQIVIINKKPYLSEFREDGKRYIGGEPFSEVKKRMSPEDITQLKTLDGLWSAHNEEIFKLIHDTLHWGYKWGIFDAITESFKFDLRQTKRANVTYDHSRYGDLVEEVLDYLNIKAGTKYKHSTQAHALLIIERARDGYEVADFKKVIDRQVYYWYGDANMIQYLRPSTLFNKTKFEEYVNGTWNTTGGGNAQQDITGGSGAGNNGQGLGNNIPAGAGANKKVAAGRKKHDAIEALEYTKRK